LLVGGTGQGKTELLNLLGNLNTLSIIKDIKGFKRINKADVENQEGGNMASKTNDVVKYVIEIGHATFTIIDTTGFGDTRGLETDKINVEKIKQAVISEGSINCICVIQNGRESRINTQLNYVFSSLTKILPKAIS